MSKCLLCQKREATKKGSHIIPSFFMKRINSIDGCNERDHELGFSIGLGTVESYFGRDVYEDRRREYTDDESRIDDRTNLDTMDNVFCPECEKLFSKYESKYSQIYNHPFDKVLIETPFLTGSEAALFWYGVIWRISATNQFKVKLKSEFEEKLRQAVLKQDVCDSDVYYALNYCKGYREADNPTFALFDCDGDVAMLIVDEFMTVLFDRKEATQNNKWLWGMNYKCDVEKLNNGRKPERIGLFPIPVFKYINDNILRQLLKRIDFRGKFNAMHQTLFGHDMPDFFYPEVMAEVDKAKLADRFTVRNYALAVKRVILSHPDIYRVRFAEEY